MVDVRCIICVSVLSRRYSLTPVLPHRLFTITAWALGVYFYAVRITKKIRETLKKSFDAIEMSGL